jgi:haloalkane dehalogenase
MVHDLGGPIGLFWAVRQSERLSSLILLNTLVYPKFSWGVILFTAAFRLPFTQDYLTSARGIKTALRIGVQNSERIQGELLETYQKPFRTKAERQALKKSATRLSIKGFKEIAKKLPSLKVPVRAIYGTNDWALPKVAQTMELVKKDLPQTEITALSNCGHFLQEDEPELVAGLVSEFLNKI